MVANFFFGVGSMIIFGLVTVMLTEFMPEKSSNGVAINNFARNILSCAGIVVAEPIILSLGNGWLFTVLGLWALLSGVCIWIMRRYGPRWRENMDKALNQAPA